MSPEDIEREKRNINLMSQEQMAELWRFAPPGHPYFDRRYPLFELFNERFQKLGGMTTEISKKIGW